MPETKELTAEEWAYEAAYTLMLTVREDEFYERVHHAKGALLAAKEQGRAEMREKCAIKSEIELATGDPDLIPEVIRALSTAEPTETDRPGNRTSSPAEQVLP